MSQLDSTIRAIMRSLEPSNFIGSLVSTTQSVSLKVDIAVAKKNS